jgi:hypothetical protein
VKRRTLEVVLVTALMMMVAALCLIVLHNWSMPKRCTTDTDCMLKYGGDGSPRP